METYDLKIYPHKLMVRGNKDQITAMHYAEEVYLIVLNMLKKRKIKYLDESNNEDCILLILEPDNELTKLVVKRILCIFDCVSKRRRFILE
jgi:hypothetical protein